MSVTIIGEAGVAHGGDVNVALKLCDAAAAADVDIVKFQTYDPVAAIHPKHSEYKLLEQLALSRQDFIKIAKHCEGLELEFMSTPGDVGSLKFLVEEVGVKRIKIGSDDLTYEPLLKAASAAKLPIILSTGMATLREVYQAVRTVGWFTRELTILHCVSAYPCKYEDANLQAIRTLIADFEHPIGYSDHCKGFLACAAAVAAGAVMIEKHFELMEHPGVDTAVSIDDDTLVEMVKEIRMVELMLGNGIKEPCEAEKVNITKFRKGADGLKCA